MLDMFSFPAAKNRILLIVALSLFSFILLFTFKAAYQTADSIGYAYSIKTGTGLFHPHHLLYNPVVRILFLLTSRIGDPNNAVLPGQIYNIFWAIVTVVSTFFIAERLFGSRSVGLLGAVFLLITRGVWEIATQNTIYLPAAGSLALLVAVIVVCFDGEQSVRNSIVISLLFALTVLNHQVNVLFSIPLGYFLIITYRKHRFRNTILVLLSAAVLVFLTYFLLFITTKPNWTLVKFYRYCFLYATYPQPDWGTVTHFSPPGIYHLLQSQLWNLIAIPEHLQSGAVVLFGLLLAGLVFWNIFRIYHHAAYAKIRIFLLIWLGVYGLFYLWWLPTYTHPFVITLFPIILLGIFTAKEILEKVIKSIEYTKIMGEVILIVIVFISLINFNAAILPLHHAKGALYQDAVKLDSLVPQTSVIFTDYTVREYLRYYFKRENAFAAEVPMLNFYQAYPFVREYLSEQEEALIPLSYIVPTYKCTLYTGYTNPNEWFKYFGWLFNFKYDGNHQLVSCRQFRIITDNDGITYVYLLPSEMKITGLPELFQMLDKQIIKSYHLETNPFQSWLNTSLPKQ
jgi:hypothetical protein